jgi:hypothetical protein
MLFTPKYDPTAIPISGRAFAHRRRTASQRAGLAAQLVLGEGVLANPTVKQAASLLQVSRPYVQVALKATTGQRENLVSGRLTVSRLKPSPCDLLVRDWNAANDAERVEFARRVGVDQIFDTAIAPVIA